MTDYEKATSFDALYKGLKKSCNNVRWKDSTVGYEFNALKNTYNLRQSLLDGSYKIGDYQRFVINEPKRRVIMATRLKDRQFQRALCDNGLYRQLTKSFIVDNGACQIGRGVDYQMKRLTEQLRRYYTTQKTNKGWVLVCDIRKYFESIPHDVAKSAIRKRVKDKDMAERACDIVDSFGERGVGLGSQVSQLIALSVLDELDHFIKERLRVKHYVRYSDDSVFVHNNREFLEWCRGEVDSWLRGVGLELNQKTTVHRLESGIKFLKWRFILTSSGKTIKKMDKSKQGRQRRKLKKIYAKELAGEYPEGSAQNSLNSWLANAERGNTFHERRRMINYFERMRERNGQSN